MQVFYCSSDGSNKKFASGKIHFQFLYTRLIYRCLSSASVVICSWFIYELQKSTTIAFSRNSLYTFYSRNPTCGIPPCLRISNRKYPPCPQNSIIVNPPSPSEILKAVCGIGMDIFWNCLLANRQCVVPENIPTSPTEDSLICTPPPPHDFPFQGVFDDPLPPGISRIFKWRLRLPSFGNSKWFWYLTTKKENTNSVTKIR